MLWCGFAIGASRLVDRSAIEAPGGDALRERGQQMAETGFYSGSARVRAATGIGPSVVVSSVAKLRIMDVPAT